MNNQKIAYLYALGTVLLWSTVASAFKITLRYLDVIPLLFYASFTSTAIFFIYLLFSKKLNLLKTLSKKDYLRSALLGFLNPFLYYVILLKAYSLLPAQQAQPINFIWPITLVLLSIPLLKQKIRLRDILAVMISFVGVLIISTQGDILGFKFASPAGVLLAVSSTVIWSLFWIYNVKDKCDEAVRLFLNFTFGSAFILLLMLFFTKVKIPNLKGALGAIYIGLFEMGVTFLLWLKALKLSKTTAYVANLIYLAPFLSLAVISIAVGEKILPSTVTGLVFIVGGIIFQKL
ncbi:MAG: DMT family transporter [Planctomycetota bacterium]|nr:DMT family transporter [Planctomycetota bacterium]